MRLTDFLCLLEKEKISIELAGDNLKIFGFYKPVKKEIQEVLKNNKKLVTSYLKRVNECKALARRLDDEPLLSEEERARLLERYEIVLDDICWLEYRQLNVGLQVDIQTLFD